ncbi:hypothetical protein OIDMADRAFT_20021 [Oidiodendron maius Zn]|uniref:Tc1-like transposase DDE domain-containing protein n=1 Tax=Oidiodendron maius (strain Zn) TaxID=913774 RepID=A0A0C3DBT4_OIDMZ|nr:hypothetical protein OIDMADRAFT_20021 [Oidiodendron maius Zn]
MFWAAFWYSKHTELATIPSDPVSARGGVSVYQYIKVLEEYIPTILETNTFFIYNNVRVYTAILVQEWFAKRDINIIDHLPFSPDINPIKNLWKILKAKIIELYPELITINDNNATRQFLIRAVKEV